MPSVPWRVEFSKIFNFFFKIPKRPKIVPKSIQTCFELVLGQIFRNFFAQCSVEGRVFENFQKKIFKIPKMPKSVLKSIQTCFEHVLGKIFRKKFLPSVPWRVEFSKIFNKKIFSKFQKCPKVFPKVSKHVLNMFLGQTFRKIFAQFSMECRVFENFKNIYLQNYKNAQKCSQKYPNVF